MSRAARTRLFKIQRYAQIGLIKRRKPIWVILAIQIYCIQQEHIIARKGIATMAAFQVY